MFNGEEETLFNGVEKQNDYKQRAIPNFLSFVFRNSEKKDIVFEFENLNEEEMFNLFKQVDATKPIEIVLRMNEDLSNRRLIFKQGDKEFPIKKIDLDNMWEYKNYN